MRAPSAESAQRIWSSRLQPWISVFSSTAHPCSCGAYCFSCCLQSRLSRLDVRPLWSWVRRVSSRGSVRKCFGQNRVRERRTVFPVYICSKHRVGERMTVLSPESVCPPPAIPGAVWSTSLSPSSVEYGSKWECYCAVVHRSFSSRQSQTLSCLALPYPHIFSCKKLSPFGSTPDGRWGG